MSDIPGVYTVMNTLIAEIASERGEDLEEFKQALLAKIKKGADAGTSTPPKTHMQRKTTQHKKVRSFNE